jgi:tellurite resistance protein
MAGLLAAMLDGQVEPSQLRALSRRVRRDARLRRACDGPAA